jgi:hypothetical protein
MAQAEDLQLFPAAPTRIAENIPRPAQNGKWRGDTVGIRFVLASTFVLENCVVKNRSGTI